MITITTEGGTMFTVQDGNVTITQTNKFAQPEVTIPVDDLEGFWDQYLDAIADDEDKDE